MTFNFEGKRRYARTHFAQALAQLCHVAAHTLVLQLLAAKVEGAIAVVNAYLLGKTSPRGLYGL
jgi:hypothetical protein